MSNLLEKASILLTPTAYDDGKILSVKPIDGSGDFQFTRNSDATRVNSAGLIESLQTLSNNLVSNGDFSQEGSELITNGDFATDLSGWAIGGTDATNTITWETNGARIISTTNLVSIQQSNILTIGKSYKLTCDVAITTGSIGLDGATSGSAIVMVEGFNEIYFTAISNYVKIKRITTNSNCLLDNVSVKEVGQDWTLGTDWSIGNNKATKVAGSTNNGIEQPNIFANGKKYKLNFTISDYGGTGGITAYIGQGSQVIASGLRDGDKEFIFTSTTNADKLLLNGFSTFSGSVSNVSVIEITDDTNLPRIDYSPYSGAGTCGHWLFEPQSTNTATYSNDFTQGTNFNSGNRTLGDSVLSANQGTAPDGKNTAQKLTDNNGGGTGAISLSSFGAGLTSGQDSTVSIFVKKDTVRYFTITFTNFDTTQQTGFDLDTGNILNSGSNTGPGVMTNYGNGWYRCSATFSTTTDLVGAIIFSITNNSGTNGGNLRDGSNSTLLWGYQAEESSFATSYIPTNESTVTRNQEAAFGSGNSSLINSTEGTLYAEIAALTQRPDFRTDIALSDGTSAGNVVRIHYLSTVDNTIRVQVRSGGAITVSQSTTVTDIRDFHKIALSYKVNEVKFYIDGVLINTDPNAAMPIGLNQLSFSAGNDTSNEFFGKTKCVAVFKEALTDDELECLTSDETSFSSFNALALANNYTII